MSGHRRHRGGFTLVEMVVASAISAILLMSLGGVVMLSASAVPSMNERARTRQDVASFIADLQLELQAAERILNVAPGSLQFTIPDRDGDGEPEVILYQSSSVNSSTVVVRSVNGLDNLEVVLSEGAPTIRFAAERSVRTERVPGPSIEDSVDSVLAEFDAGSWTAASNPNTIRWMAIHQDDWAAQMLEPIPPADAIAWRPTELAIPMSKSTAARDTISVALRRASRLQPAGSAGSLRSRSMTSGNGNNKALVTVLVEDPESGDGLDADLLVPRGESMAMVLGSDRSPFSGSHARLAWCSPADPVATPADGRAISGDGGETWDRYGGQAFEYRLTGRWVRRSSDVMVLDHVFLEAIHVCLEMDGQLVHAGRIDLPARPRWDKGRWDLEVVGGDTTTPPGWQGTLTPSVIFTAAPVDRLTTPFAAEFEFESDSNGAETTIDIRADRSSGGDNHLPVRVQYRQESASERRIEIRTADSAGQWQVVSWWTQENPEQSLAGRVVVFPDEAVVAVELGGEYRGTFPLERPAWDATESLAVELGSEQPSLVRLSVARPEPLP